MFHLYWYLYYGMNALKWFIIYQFAKLNISCICSPSMKSSLFLYHAMTSACRCLERKQDYVTWKKLTLNFTCWEQNVVVKGKYPELRRNYMHLHDLEHHYLNRKVFHIPIGRFAKTWLSSLAQGKICFLYLLSHHLVRKVKGKLTVFLIYIKSVLNVTHKNPHLKYKYIVFFLVYTCAFMRQIDGILKARKVHIYLFRKEFLLFSTIVVVTKIKMHINIIASFRWFVLQKENPWD